VNETIAQAVRERAGGRCEYCRLPAAHVQVPFEIEHIIPRQHGGTDALGNLALACLHCNRYKGPNLAGHDRATSRTKLIRLFHPRRHSWEYHFTIVGPKLVGRTPIGRATVEVLRMNAPLFVAVREELIEDGLF
jgi:hypothetical protein